MDKLPSDVIRYVLWSFLTPVDQINLKLTNKICYKLQTKDIKIKLDSLPYSEECIKNGYLGLIKKLKKIPKNIYSIAAENDQLDTLKWARHIGRCEWDENACAHAARGGHIHILKWLRDNNCPWDRWTCAYAAGGGYLDILKWAHKNGCEWSEEICSGAAHSGHLEILQWARENGCPWDHWTCVDAADGGHLNILKWAHANGCPCDEMACASAFDNGHLEILDWLQTQGYSYNYELSLTIYPNN
jgi:hypothetical protein